MPTDTSSVDYINKTVTDTSVVNTNATGQAYQGVANSMALAVENASTNLLNFSTIIQAGLAKALEMYIETQSPTWLTVITGLQTAQDAQAATLKSVGMDAGVVMALFGELTQQKFSDILTHYGSTPSGGTPSGGTQPDTTAPAEQPSQDPSPAPQPKD